MGHNFVRINKLGRPSQLDGDPFTYMGTPIPAWRGRSRTKTGIDTDQTKRLFDIVVSSALLLFFSPLFAIVAIAIMLRRDGPVIFGHERIGKNGVPFDCLKFRTMHAEGDRILAQALAANPLLQAEWAMTQKLQRDPRVSILGKLLRKSSLDELPQLINVLRGEMSLVGPRPVVEDEWINYGDDFAYYLSVRPGVTGLWQVSGRNNTSYAERVALDVKYVSSRTFLGDLKIMVRTVRVVLTGYGAY